MRVLVTGGAGFVGTHVVSALSAAGHEPYVFDIQEPRYGTFIRGDLTRLDDLVAATADMDAVCHLGAVGDVYLAVCRREACRPHLSCCGRAKSRL